MRVKNFTPGGKSERKLLTAMVLNKTVLAWVAARWPAQGGPFASQGANLLGSWCVEHFRKFDKAPAGDIVTYFEKWSENPHKEEDRQHVDRFLSSLSQEYAQDGWKTNGEIDVKYTLDLAGRHFNRVLVERAHEQIGQYIEAGQHDKAGDLMSSYTRVVLTDSGVIRYGQDYLRGLAVGRPDRTLISPSGGLGRFFQGQLEKDGFVAFMASQKTGKSFWCLEMAVQAMLCRRKVTYFQVGDLSEHQVGGRIVTRLGHRPHRSPTGEWPVEVRYPTSLDVRRRTDGPPQAQVRFKAKTFDRAPTADESWHGVEAFTRKKLRMKELPLAMHWCPVGGISVDGVRSVLRSDEHDGWVPDVVVIDYADNLAPCNPRQEERNQINDTWYRLRQLSQDRSVLVITATQANARSYEGCWVLERKHFSNDNRKLNHVTGMVGINVTAAEKERQVQRLNWVALREGDFTPTHCCWVAGCLALARPAVLSHF